MSSSPVDKPLPLANTFDELSGPLVDVSVSDDSCPGCGGALEHEGVDVAYVTDIPAKPKTQVTEYRVRRCVGVVAAADGYVDATRTCHRGRYAGIDIRGGRRLGRDSGFRDSQYN